MCSTGRSAVRITVRRSGDGSRYTTKWPLRVRIPDRVTAAKSAEARNRCAAGNTKRVGSGRQFAAALATAGRQDGAAGAGAHPKPEPVGLRPTAVIRLEGPLAHGLAPSQIKFRDGKPPRPTWTCRVEVMRWFNHTPRIRHRQYCPLDSTDSSTVRMEPRRGQTERPPTGARTTGSLWEDHKSTNVPTDNPFNTSRHAVTRGRNQILP